jgi:hypothetical protein
MFAVISLSTAASTTAACVHCRDSEDRKNTHRSHCKWVTLAGCPLSEEEEEEEEHRGALGRLQLSLPSPLPWPVWSLTSGSDNSGGVQTQIQFVNSSRFHLIPIHIFDHNFAEQSKRSRVRELERG